MTVAGHKNSKIQKKERWIKHKKTKIDCYLGFEKLLGRSVVFNKSVVVTFTYIDALFHFVVIRK